MSVIIMPKLQAYTDAVYKIGVAADRCVTSENRERVMDHLRISLAFYQAVVTTNNDMMRQVSFEAAVLELCAANEYLPEQAIVRGVTSLLPG